MAELYSTWRCRCSGTFHCLDQSFVHHFLLSLVDQRGQWVKISSLRRLSAKLCSQISCNAIRATGCARGFDNVIHGAWCHHDREALVIWWYFDGCLLNIRIMILEARLYSLILVVMSTIVLVVVAIFYLMSLGHLWPGRHSGFPQSWKVMEIFVVMESHGKWQVRDYMQ